MCKHKYPDTRRILITAAGSGTNGHRASLWKFELARLAAATGLNIIVCHYPPGTSKWNNVEYRLVSRITHNWRGQPLEAYQTIVNLIADTTTTTGLTVHCELDSDLYHTRTKLTSQQKKSIPLTPHQFHHNCVREALETEPYAPSLGRHQHAGGGSPVPPSQGGSELPQPAAAGRMATSAATPAAEDSSAAVTCRVEPAGEVTEGPVVAQHTPEIKIVKIRV